ncbi:MAG TPA: pentapeptide repeat-containing protein [Herbaspirillum sp.]
MLNETNAGTVSFDLHAPLHGLHVRRRDITRLLENISPDLADASITGSIREMVKNFKPSKGADATTRETMIMDIDANRAPVSWDTEAMLFILNIGHWDEIDLSHGVFNQADLRGARLQGAILRYANLQSALMSGANLQNTDMTGVKASGTIFTGADFHGALLQDTDFQRAQLDNAVGIACCSGTNFSDASLKHVQMSLRRSTNQNWCYRESQLAALSTIYSRHNDVYREAVLTLLLGSMCVSGEVPNINLFMSPLLNADRSPANIPFNRLIAETLMPPLLERWNHAARSDDDPQFTDVVSYLFCNNPKLAWPRYCGAMSQLVLRDTQSEPPSFRTQDFALRARFALHTDIEPVTLALQNHDEDLPMFSSIFMNPACNLAVVYEDATLRGLSRGIDSPYNGYLLRKDENGAFQFETLRNLKEIIECSVPLALYNVAPPPQAAIGMLSSIFDKSPYKNKFIDALICKTLPPPEEDKAGRRIPFTEDVPLMQHLMKLCECGKDTDELRISAKHVKQLWQTFNSTFSAGKRLADTPANQARMLLCLGTLFVKYSSAALFGTDQDSLLSLRAFAWACLNRAGRLDCKLLGHWESKGIRETLVGRNDMSGVRQCSAEQTDRLTKLIEERAAEDPALTTCYSTLYPQAWK